MVSQRSRTRAYPLRRFATPILTRLLGASLPSRSPPRRRVQSRVFLWSGFFVGLFSAINTIKWIALARSGYRALRRACGARYMQSQPSPQALARIASAGDDDSDGAGSVGGDVEMGAARFLPQSDSRSGGGGAKLPVVSGAPSEDVPRSEPTATPAG